MASVAMGMLFDVPVAKRRVSKTDSVQKQAIDLFCQKWAAKYATRYPFGGGKDAAAIKWMLGQVERDLVKLGRIFDFYFADNDRFVAFSNRHSVGILRLKFVTYYQVALAQQCSRKGVYLGAERL